MIPIQIPATILLLMFFVLILVFCIKKRISIFQSFMLFFFSIYLTSVVCIVFFPFPIQYELIQDSIKMGWSEEYNFIPFKSLITDLRNGIFRSGLGNVLLFVPLGFGLPFLFSSYEKFKKTIITGIVSSMFIEISQAILGFYLGFNYRIVDIDDVIANSTGAVLGYFLYVFLSSSIKRFCKQHDLKLKIK